MYGVLLCRSLVSFCEAPHKHQPSLRPPGSDAIVRAPSGASAT